MSQSPTTNPFPECVYLLIFVSFKVGLSAIHQTVTEPLLDRRKLLLLADSHISDALQIYRKILVEPSLETALPAFLLSSLLVSYTLASAQIEEPVHPLDSIHHCFRLFQGVSLGG